MAQSDDAGYKGDAEEGIECGIEDIPESDVIASYFPKLGYLVEDVCRSHDIEDSFYNIEISSAVDGVDGDGVQSEVEDGEEDLHDILVKRCAHTVRVEVVPVIGVGFLGPGDKIRGPLIILNEPTSPEIGDAFLVA